MRFFFILLAIAAADLVSADVVLAKPLVTKAEPGSIAARTKLPEAALQHRGDRRKYVVYPGQRVVFSVQSPASVELAVRAVFGKKKRRARLRLKLRSAGQVLLDQSQTLGLDRRAKYPNARVTRPLVAVADIPQGSKSFSIEIKYRDRNLQDLIFSVRALKYEEDFPDSAASTGSDSMVPGLVGLGGDLAPAAEPSLEALVPGDSQASADSSVAIDTGAEEKKAEAVLPQQPYVPGRFVALDLGVQFGLGFPGIELGGRYFLPFWSERLALGVRLGYRQIYEQRSLDLSSSASLLRLRLHVLNPAVFVQADLWREPLFFAGLMFEGGALPFFGNLQQQTLLTVDQNHLDQSDLSGLTWFAGASLVAGLNLAVGQLEVDLGYRYAPAAEASDPRDERRHIAVPVMGPHLGLAYRFTW